VTRDLYSATHEAAHLLIALSVGLEVKDAKVNRTHRGGLSRIVCADKDGHLEKPMAVLAVALAGSIADSGDLSRMSPSDRKLADEAVRLIKGRASDALATAERICRFHLQRHAGAVHALAEELHRRGNLLRFEIRAIIERNGWKPSPSVRQTELNYVKAAERFNALVAKEIARRKAVGRY
jgi:hypothetical protein